MRLPRWSEFESSRNLDEINMRHTFLHFVYNQKYVPTLKRSVQHVLFPQIFGSWEASFLENKTVLILSSRSTIFGVRSCMEESLQTCTWLYVTKHGGKIMIVESLPCCWSFWERSKNKCHENYFSLSFSMEVEMAHGFSKACKNVLSYEWFTGKVTLFAPRTNCLN